MTRLIWKRLWRSSLVSSVLFLTPGCKEPDAVRGKIYISDPRQGGIVRSQVGELIPYAKTKGFYCISGEDLELFLIEWENGLKAIETQTEIDPD